MTEKEQAELFGLSYGGKTRFFLQAFATNGEGNIVGKSQLKSLNFKGKPLTFGKEYDTLQELPVRRAIAYDPETDRIAPIIGMLPSAMRGAKQSMQYTPRFV